MHKEALLKLVLGYKVELLTKSCFPLAAAANFSYYSLLIAYYFIEDTNEVPLHIYDYSVFNLAPKLFCINVLVKL